MTLAAERAIHIKTYGIVFLRDIQSDVFLCLLDLFIRFGSDDLLYYKFCLAGRAAHDLNGTPDVVDFQRAMLDAGHGKRFLNGLLLLHRQVAIGFVKRNW